MLRQGVVKSGVLSLDWISLPNRTFQFEFGLFPALSWSIARRGQSLRLSSLSELLQEEGRAAWVRDDQGIERVDAGGCHTNTDRAPRGQTRPQGWDLGLGLHCLGSSSTLTVGPRCPGSQWHSLTKALLECQPFSGVRGVLGCVSSHWPPRLPVFV